ncbi:cytochrome c oxidase accessory protein CcoG [Dyadobacter sp. CY343]|uniref:cytochrome c oxidase accessory protein CcoG n=1 Tax=Dyadobacter sp. CY343 TaxID=2907299 RepID=UPI001F35EB26|nr:cytochrome c oxidase accessory protein CcoG [Dyadobacter sp. CY343]MCE7060625.1 cytochrome c oxidase accessory protein CcoG [Dyadobacter sp. CY343]
MSIPNYIPQDQKPAARGQQLKANSQQLKADSKLYPQKPKGKWHNRRVVFSVAVLSILFITPFINIGGQPILLLNVLERKFIIFGLFIGPQDYWLFGVMMLTFMVMIVLFTVVFGRLWCGWACPQTVFMEMVFRKIEYAIEGDAGKQKLLDKAPWTADKLFKKALKYSIFLAVSFVIANLLLAYIVGVDELSRIVHEPLEDHIPLFSGIVAFTAIFYFNFAWLREKACTVVCPYGRLQSVLIDRNTITVAYDHERGETRGKLHKNEIRTNGDCIDCFQCVAVCPTGIDIRNGNQMECVNCTACIDACDAIMEKIDFKKGLIRYTSENEIERKSGKSFGPRVWGYAAVLLLLCGGLVGMIATRSDTQTSFLRTPGSRYIENKDNTVSNLYTFKIFNKTNRTITPTIRLNAPDGTLLFAGSPDLTMQPAGMAEGTVFVTIPKTSLPNRKTVIKMSVYQGDIFLEDFETTFMAPQD